MTNLQSIMQFTVGKNPTRMKDIEEEQKYTPEDFENDLHSCNTIDENAGCIINLIKTKAAPMSKENREKCITSNFLKCEFDKNKLDPWFFCYQFNEGLDFEKQIQKYHQGTTISVKKLNIKNIGEFEIKLPNIDKQRIIGKLYKQTIIQKDMLEKQIENKTKLSMEIIRRIEED